MKHTNTVATSVASLAAISLTFAAMHSYAQEVLFTDDFKTADPAWGTTTVIKDGKMTITSEANKNHSCLNQSNLFQDMTCSATARIVTGPDDTDAGLLFWAKDYGDYYIAEYNSRGQVAIGRYVSGRWLYPVPWRDCPEAKKGAGQTNVIKVVTRGNQATFNINGKDVVTLKGQPPAGGGLIGFETGGNEKEGAVSEFSDLKVTK